ncbi:hypothetical protein O7627_36375 [Solwaraspora sp. WMMD1047]|uniref:hypothetical protein n=1 Tax=Solwaraspora sp. WMMD1047 TaxID=3016102 RepID=UPI002416B1F5|nr:hypothetical protein [Solwaraspora sp. WMMD1047]MDG4834746.1 hypothetical protein [Solwaraspora sp. WMMD1047]
MTRDAERLLRTAVHDLAGDGRPTADLLPGAIARGRRVRRRRRITATAATAVAAVIAITGPFIWLRPDPVGQLTGAPTVSQTPPATPVSTPPPPTAGPPPTVGPPPLTDWKGQPFELPGGWLVVGGTSTGGPASPGLVLDRDQGRYRSISGYDETWAAPKGGFAAVFDYDRRTETGLLDLDTDEVRWVRTGGRILDPQWSPDGSKLLLTLSAKTPAGHSFGVLSVKGRLQIFTVDAERYFCTDYCQFTWLPDGKRVALAQTDPAGARSESVRHPRRGLQIFSAVTGKPTNFIPVRGDAAGPTAWSPDGRLVVVQGQHSTQLVVIASGEPLRELPVSDAHWVAPDRILYLDRPARWAVLVDTAGTVLERRPIPPDLAELRILVAPA